MATLHSGADCATRSPGRGMTSHFSNAMFRTMPMIAIWSALNPTNWFLYPSWGEVNSLAKSAIAESDVAVVTSYCPDALAACALVLESKAAKVFYDLDTAVTLQNFRAHGSVDYIPA